MVVRADPSASLRSGLNEANSQLNEAVEVGARGVFLDGSVDVECEG